MSTSSKASARIRILWVLPIFLMFGCATTPPTKRPPGENEFVVGCGAGSAWNACHTKASKLCPSGYRTLEERTGFNRKELRIECANSGADAK